MLTVQPPKGKKLLLLLNGTGQVMSRVTQDVESIRMFPGQGIALSRELEGKALDT